MLGEVTSLKHELGDDTVEAGALVPKALLAGAESAEVLGGLWDSLIKEFEVDAAGAFYHMSESVSSYVLSIERSQRCRVSIGEGVRSFHTLIVLVHRGDLAIGIARRLRTRPGTVATSLHQPSPSPSSQPFHPPPMASSSKNPMNNMFLGILSHKLQTKLIIDDEILDNLSITKEVD